MTVQDEWGVLSGDRFLSQEEIRVRAARAASGLRAAGIGRGDAVALLLRNDCTYIEACLAAGKVGAFPVPINWHWKRDEVLYLLEDSGAKALIAHDDLLDDVGALPPDLLVLPVETPEHFGGSSGGSLDTSDRSNRVPYDSWRERHDPLSDELGDAASLSMIYTSGTTGRPKGVQRIAADAEQTERYREMFTAVFGLVPGMRTIVPAPLYHSAPNVFALGAFGIGSFMVLMPRFDPMTFLAMVEEHRITHVQMVPTHFVRLLRLPKNVRSRFDLSSLRFVVHAAAPCPPEVKQQMIDWLGPIIWEYYGCTESGAVVLCDSEEWLAHPGTVGRPFLGSEVRIVGAAGDELGPNDIGDVYVRMHGTPDFTYRGDPEKRARAGRGELVTCGDVGYLDDDGFLYLKDRRNDMVISGGVNVYPAEIEGALLELACVRDCAVFGIPDEDLGEVLAAHIEVEDGAVLGAEEVQRFLRERLADYKVPKVVQFEEELPREDTGKIFKRRIRERYWQS